MVEVEQPSELINLDTPPVASELTKALAAILNQQEVRLNILLVIDGLDECEGDPVELAEILTCMATSTQKTKLLVSSRPIPACLTAFGQGPKLRLQDLTRQDICRYVHAELNRHPQFCALAEVYPERADSVIRQITERSEGVFLWVKLVVRSVLVGLENGDRMNELESRLSSLPADLEGLYERMLERTPLMYQPQGAQMLIVVQHWPALQAMGAFRQQRVHFTTLLLALGGEVTQDELESFAQDDGKADRFLMSRCGGLLEASDAMLEPLRPGWLSGEASPVVQYIHKTVAEFLERHSVSQQLHRRLTNKENVNIVLLDACIRKIELANQTRAHVDHTQHALLGWKGAVALFQLAEQATRQSQTRRFKDFDQHMVEACTRHLTYVGSSSDQHSVHWSECFDDVNWEIVTGGWCHDQVSAAIRYDLPLTAEALLRNQLPTKRGRFYLECALHGVAKPPYWNMNWDASLKTRQRRLSPMIYMLLSNGCDPNEVFQDRTAWQTLGRNFFDSCCHHWASEWGSECPHRLHEDVIQLDDWAQALEHFVNFGADPDIQIQSCRCMTNLPDELHLRDAIRYVSIIGPQSTDSAVLFEDRNRLEGLGKRLLQILDDESVRKRAKRPRLEQRGQNIHGSRKQRPPHRTKERRR